MSDCCDLCGALGCCTNIEGWAVCVDCEDDLSSESSDDQPESITSSLTLANLERVNDRMMTATNPNPIIRFEYRHNTVVKDWMIRFTEKLRANNPSPNPLLPIAPGLMGVPITETEDESCEPKHNGEVVMWAVHEDGARMPIPLVVDGDSECNHVLDIVRNLLIANQSTGRVKNE